MSCEMGSNPNPKTSDKVPLLGLSHIFADGLKQDGSTFYSTNCSWDCIKTMPGRYRRSAASYQPCSCVIGKDRMTSPEHISSCLILIRSVLLEVVKELGEQFCKLTDRFGPKITRHTSKPKRKAAV